MCPQPSFIALAAVLFVAGAATADAHARLLRATPAVGTTVQAAPSEVTLRFSEKLEPAFSSVIVRDPEGKPVSNGNSTVDKGDRATMRINLQPLPPGVYKVEWHATSSDTHKVSGDFTFKVAP